MSYPGPFNFVRDELMLNLWIYHFYSLPVFLIIVLLLSLINLLTIKKIGHYSIASRLPFVSILIPARNEEKNIAACVISLINQDYPHLEVLVLDDQSTDTTWKILQNLKKGHPELKIIHGKLLPEGRLGKPWACQQLSEASKGELILFTDADTSHQPRMLKQAVSAMLAERADLLTAMVRLKIDSFGEGLLVPFMYWSLMTFFPVKLASKLKIPALSASVGQFLLFKRDAYQQIGGHQAIQNEVVDDFQLGRNIIRQNLNHHFADAIDFVDCRMYSGLKEAIQGFKKNFYPAFNYNFFLFFFVFLFLLTVYFEPLIVLLLKITNNLSVDMGWIPLIASILLALIQPVVCYFRLKVPIYYALLYPLWISVVALTAMLSFSGHKNKKITWKDRYL